MLWIAEFVAFLWNTYYVYIVVYVGNFAASWASPEYYMATLCGDII